ncbi:hypothetical protein GCM10010912_09260 [Paenibacillus albidus]|uniref:SWIM-type domain-containing protein n=1 Tax=Paenibacillus albidus TaxID=2041023 RepID=A0A917C0P8_9BACL|nr:SWIM zinc finger family protein [Paenibacillus albidus]GGF66392.1 hypothetical protein GCM10010912_09260 [Paenibacillus albidus]
MQPNYDLNDDQWDQLIQNVAYSFDDLTLKRGFQYYKQQRVKPFAMTDSRKINACVEGREVYRLALDLDDLTAKSCDCPVQRPCKHMAAVLMEFAERQQRSVHMLANAKAASAAFKPAIAKSAGKAAPLSTLLSVRHEQLVEQAARLPSGGVAEWREFLDNCTSPLAPSIRNPQYVDRALAAVAKVTPKLPPVLDELFRLHTLLFLLETLTKPLGNQTNTFVSSLGYFTHLAVTEVQDALESLLRKKLPLAAHPELFPHVTETLDYLRHEMLTESRNQSYFSASYSLFWTCWLMPASGSRQLFLDEIEQLEQARQELGASLSRHAWQLAYSRMLFYAEDDEAAWESLDHTADRPGLDPGELMSFLPPLSEAKDWSRLADWLTRIGPMLSTRIRYNLKDYSQYWEETLRELPEAEPRMWETLAAMLPLAHEVYSEKLLEYGKWQDWMDFQLSDDKAPADFRVRDLQPLEKNAPELLLPFYHQAVERFVVEKNRHSYKAAVKLLKRLAKLYKKLKREERWALFLEGFTARHSRLRALQEELRKGNLIP